MIIHFIGIGGIGVSALARLYLARGHRVSGSDLNFSATVDDLKKLGAKIFIGQRAENIDPKTDLVIHTVAVPKNNPELRAAKKLKIKTQTYAQALGELTKQYFTIAISGTHGKSTTTSMLALLMERAGLDPTVIVGTKIKEWDGSNCRVGKGKYLLIEADEYTAAFLNYWPQMIVVTNIEAEHLDFYKDLSHILKTFEKYLKHLGGAGFLVANADDSNILSLSTRLKNDKKWLAKIWLYSLRQKEADQLRKILKVPGEHNVSNALAALGAARILGIGDKISFKALANYRGAWRRFEFRKKVNGALIFDDYGHHPTEVRVTLAGAREFMKTKKMSGRLWCVFQPHHYERLNSLFKNFIGAFDQADEIIILDVFSAAGRERDESRLKGKRLSEKLAEKISGRKKWAKFIATPEAAVQYLKTHLQKGDLVILMGAGNIYDAEI